MAFQEFDESLTDSSNLKTVSFWTYPSSYPDSTRRFVHGNAGSIFIAFITVPVQGMSHLTFMWLRDTCIGPGHTSENRNVHHPVETNGFGQSDDL